MGKNAFQCSINKKKAIKTSSVSDKVEVKANKTITKGKEKQ